MSVLMGFLSFILVVFPLVIIHEFGHWVVGKWLGAEPEEFSVGFGKTIVAFQKWGTNWKIGWIPLGGYVKFKKTQFAMEFGEGEKTGEKLPAFKWIWISVAGPLSNFLLTMLIFAGLTFYTMTNTQVGKTADGKKILVVNLEDSALRQNLLGVEKTGTYFVSSDKGYVPYELQPTDKVESVSALSAMGAAAVIGPVFIYHGSIETAKALGNLFVSKEGYKNLMGPVGIAGVASEARSSGLVSVLFIMASLSFAIGFFNLLPLAFLDGGRAVLAAYEVVSRRTVSLKLLGLMNTISLILVLNLLVVGMFSDFMRLIK